MYFILAFRQLRIIPTTPNLAKYQTSGADIKIRLRFNRPATSESEWVHLIDPVQQNGLLSIDIRRTHTHTNTFQIHPFSLTLHRIIAEDGIQLRVLAWNQFHFIGLASYESCVFWYFIFPIDSLAVLASAHTTHTLSYSVLFYYYVLSLRRIVSDVFQDFSYRTTINYEIHIFSRVDVGMCLCIAVWRNRLPLVLPVGQGVVHWMCSHCAPVSRLVLF